MDQENKIKFNSWALEKCLTQEIGSKPATIRSNNESESQAKNKSLCSPQFHKRVEVEIFACDKINERKDLIYIHNYNISDIDDYGSEPKKKYTLVDVQKAT